MDEEPTAPNDTHRFFAVVSDDAYETAREWLDGAFGHPRNGTQTCIAPAADAPHDSEGRPLVAMLNEQAIWPEVAAALDYYLKNALAVEITRADYFAALPSEPEI